MALTANLVRTSVTDDGLQSLWSDATVYGGANPTRPDVALWLTAYKMTEDQIATALAVTAFDPEAVTGFTTTNGDDGWHQYKFVIIPNWLVGTTYNQYDLVWSLIENKFYEYVNAAPTSGNAVTDPTYFLEVPDPTVKIANVGTAQESGNLVYQVVNKVLSYQTSICYLKAASKHAKEECSGGSCGCDSRLGKAYHKIRDLFALLAINETTGQFIEGERNALLAAKYCDECGCLTR